MKNILITRSKIRSIKLSNYLTKNGAKNFFQPLFSVKKIISENLLSSKNNSPIIISSANAIHILKKYNFSKDITIFCVGKITAQKLKNLGFVNVIHPQINSGKELSKIIIAHLNPREIFYFRGEKISFDFVKFLEKKGFKVNSEIVYKTCEISKFSEEIINLVKLKYFDEVLIFSQNSLEIFYKNCINHNLIEYFNSSNIMCMSNKIAKNARKIGFTKVSTFKKFPLLKNFYDAR
ncbi:MAG: uroporphyrinogen-III synthase [Proteobacteria bacterium]|nr:uroporphyrinogen-III synthase [Pseudomonadota bacterium]NCA28261.1 uroporphyrinogen-III synthase [Pseudomonadota bacterium]